MKKNDLYFLKEAIKEAKKAYRKNEVPVGAVIVIDGEIVARGHNLKESKESSLAHAEMIAIDRAMKKLKRSILDDATIYITLEPCLMCTGAIYQARIKRVVYGASEPKFGVLGSIIDIQEFKGFNHRIEVEKGILSEEVAEMMRSFFQNLRKK
jgi:tRNA(adenine34) deaminase